MKEHQGGAAFHISVVTHHHFCHTDQSRYSVGGDYAGCEYQQARITGGRLEGW